MTEVTVALAQGGRLSARVPGRPAAVVQQAIVQVQHATGEAVETLRGGHAGPHAPASARVSAAKAILETAVKAVELEDWKPG